MDLRAGDMMYAPRPQRPPSDGFFGGMSCFFRGLSYLARTSSLWGAAAMPMILVVVLMTALGWLGLWASGEVVATIVGEGGVLSTIFGLLLRIVFGALALVLAFLFTMALAQPLSSSALDRILRTREAHMGARAFPPIAFWENFTRGLRVSFSALGLSLPVFILLSLLNVAFPPLAVVTVPLKLVVCGMLASWDFLDYPLGIRRMDVSHRMAWIKRHFGAFMGFSVAAMLLLLLPCVGYLMVVPVGIAGAATLVVEIEGR